MRLLPASLCLTSPVTKVSLLHAPVPGTSTCAAALHITLETLVLFWTAAGSAISRQQSIDRRRQLTTTTQTVTTTTQTTRSPLRAQLLRWCTLLRIRPRLHLGSAAAAETPATATAAW